MAVPRPLQAKFGKSKLKHLLDTEDLREANRLKWPVVQALQAQIHAASQPRAPLNPMDRAAQLSKLRESGRDISIDVEYEAQELLMPIGIEGDDDRFVFHPQADQLAQEFREIAAGNYTGIDSSLSDWHEQSHRKERTHRDDLRAIRLLNDWCKATGTNFSVEALRRRKAGDFVAHLVSKTDENGRRISAKTVNKYLSSLSSYWSFMEKRGLAEENVWSRQSLPKRQAPKEERERAFTDEEIVRLLAADPVSSLVQAFMRIGALTGARIDAIACLKVGDVRGGVFRFKPQKKELEYRTVPIHSALEPLISELTQGKEAKDDLFPELPTPPKGSGRERSMPISKAFTRFRRKVGVDEVREGARRASVNFHSFRRWFITKAEQSGQPEHVIASVVGHTRPGMTFGVYSAGPSIEQLRNCVEAVRLP